MKTYYKLLGVVLSCLLFFSITYATTVDKNEVEDNVTVTHLLEKTINTHNAYNKEALYTWKPGANKQDNALYFQSLPSNAPLNPLNFINLEKLLQPIVYNPTQKAQAEAIMRTLAREVSPLSTFDFTKIASEDSRNLRLIENQAYLALLRIYAAIQSLGLANLYHIYEKRLPTITHEKKIMSPLENSAYQSTYRLKNPKWKEMVQKANSEELQREILLIMAAQLAETHEMNMTLERLLATTSASLLQFNTLLQPSEKTVNG